MSISAEVSPTLATPWSRDRPLSRACSSTGTVPGTPLATAPRRDGAETSPVAFLGGTRQQGSVAWDSGKPLSLCRVRVLLQVSNPFWRAATGLWPHSPNSCVSDCRGRDRPKWLFDCVNKLCMEALQDQVAWPSRAVCCQCCHGGP